MEHTEQQERPAQNAPEQEASPPADHQHGEALEWRGGAWEVGKKATLTGCLETSTIGAITGVLKEDAEKEFVLTRQGTEEGITVKGLADLTQHTNHMVQLTGTMQKEDEDNVFQVSEIKHVAASCAPSANPPQRGQPEAQPSQQESKRDQQQ